LPAGAKTAVLLSDKKPGELMSDLELCYLPATEAIARFKAKKLSPVELMQAVIERAEKVEKKINALPLRFYDRALAQAEEGRRKISQDRWPAAAAGGPAGRHQG